jgi:glycosyltransferase involved in cell wall biosynthesis
MNRKPLVSGIIIFLNGEKFIRDAIESVFAQTYENWELLLVDDGSTDSSTAIAQDYADRYPERIRYLEHPNHQNRGMSATRNLGIKHARGDYIAFLDSDDVWLPAKLAEQVHLMDAHPEAAMIYGRTQIWYSWTGQPEDMHRDCMFDLGVAPDTLVQPPTLLLLLLENKVQTPTTCNVLVRREVFERYGGFQEAFRGMFEDQAFFTKVCLNVSIFVADACWARYRQHPESCCAVAERTGADYAARLPLLRWMNDYFTAQQVTDQRVWKALHRELWPYQHPTLHRLRCRTREWAWQLEYYRKRLAGRVWGARVR